MEINYPALIETKLKRLLELKKGGNFSHDFRGYAREDEEIEAIYSKKKTFVEQKGTSRVKEMLVKIKEMGYEVEGGRITKAGVHSLVGKRSGIKFFGFVCPTGKLRLSVSRPESPNARRYGRFEGRAPSDIVLEINYQRINLKVHDRFLSVVMQRV